ncbi:TrmH family RNA methyltransferase [Allosphingosinicella sp.]|jgi:tRNA/rRNA methyltransferase|uniref:TrmH family RNA methyltransferase n=1 Tax=Allosphingosinicella sp. TaxID=2823234 RepID=UPI002F09BFA1
MLRCSDGHFYVGHTDDLESRVAARQAGQIPGYTQKRRPIELVWSESFPTREEAIAAERQIKNWSVEKKKGLIAGDWERVSRAARKPASREIPRYAVSTGSTATRDEREVGAPSSPPPAIVLVRPQLGENIGKAARAMLNFGLTDLRLVCPRDGWPNPAAGPAASGADVVLEGARVFECVADAVADCPFVYATTVRKRGLVLPVVSPEQAAGEIRTNDGRSAILFGAERSGLETEEAAVAGKIVTVPVNPEFRSLNLAQAVVLIAYEWSKGSELAVPTEGEPPEPRAPHAHLEGLVGQLFDALEAADYFHPPDRTPATKNTIRTILTKAGWSSREIQALRGIVRALSEPRPKG